MHAEIEQDRIIYDQLCMGTNPHGYVEYTQGEANRTLLISVDDEAAELIKFFVDTLMGRTKPVMTDQGDVTKR